MIEPLRIGITGHQHLDDESLWTKVREQLETILARQMKPFVGLTSLAIGADQLFAEIILEFGQTYEAVIPFDGYDQKFGENAKATYLKLLALASSCKTLTRLGSDEDSYFNAGKHIVDKSDLMIAIWDGEPAAGFGGTADVVEYARNRHKSLKIINPKII